ncbi:E-selectin-like [Entelurus aequoreus]|uniref:E-selectin-like n=1 Tax=Entelurus aequoreus TaxID=161455 RepID=UPI002B1E8EE6|nr:E-selectin-like [Entelurus aequoreus]XP_061895241.1 E-selectin-like [Entelurus aequoreus]
MEFCCGLFGKKFTSWSSLAIIFSMLCMQTSVECWSYFYSNNTMDWEHARAWCQERYTDMVAIQNQEEISHLNSWLPKMPTYYWIGIRKVNSTWTWVGTNKALTAEATNWALGEPNNGKNGQVLGRSEDCVEMYIKRGSQPGKWNDERCEKRKTALCYTAACQKDSCVHGECVETINSHMCQCFEGFYGDKCERVVQCSKDELTVPPKGSVDCTGKHGDFSFDSLCQYSCEDGYQLSRPGPLRCTASKSWSEPPPTCEVVRCSELSHPERGSMTCRDPVTTSGFQSLCVFACHEGYVLSGSQSLRCEASGSWNASQPTCVAVQCPALPGLDNGTVRCGEDPDVRFSYGSTCTFSCSAGYQMVGASTATCTSAAEWSETMPHCQAITCPAPDLPKGAQMNCTPSLLPSWTPYPQDTVCTFSCDEGFELQGALSAACTQPGLWTATPPTCLASTSQFNAIAAGATIGGAVSLSTLSVVMWVLKRLRRKANKFELSSNSDFEDPPQVYKNSIDSLI